MGYCLKLGYAREIVGDDSVPIGPHSRIAVIDYETATVVPFINGTSLPNALPVDDLDLLLGSELPDYGTDAADTDQYPTKREIYDSGLVLAEIDITPNYSSQILAVAGIHLAWLHGHNATKASAPLMQLIAGLSDKGCGDYWSPTDDNIKHLASTLLDWVFQHPDGVFFSTGE
jgi:hypothetical protein